jgi:hypothetical protein
VVASGLLVFGMDQNTMNKNEGKENTTGVQANDQDRSGNEQAKKGHPLPPEEIGNVTSGLSDTPDRPEPANGDCIPEKKDQ